MLQDRVDKICEMATVMNRSIELDDRAQSQEQEIMSRLITENKVIHSNFIPITLCYVDRVLQD